MSLLTNLGLTNMCLKLKINLYRSTHRCMMCIPLKYESHLDIGPSYPDRLHLTRMSTHIVKYPNLMCRYGLNVAVYVFYCTRELYSRVNRRIFSTHQLHVIV